MTYDVTNGEIYYCLHSCIETTIQDAFNTHQYVGEGVGILDHAGILEHPVIGALHLRRQVILMSYIASSIQQTSSSPPKNYDQAT